MGNPLDNYKSPPTKMTTDSPFVPTQHPVRYKTIRVRELDIFYRDAGPETAPTILLLHGFPTSSNMFRNLIPRLPHHSTWWHQTIPVSAKAACQITRISTTLS